MDRERFDALPRLLATTGSRRGTLGAVIGVALLGVSPDALARPGKGKGKGHDKSRGKGKGKDKGKNQRRNRDGKVRAQALPANCCSTNTCTPGPGKNLGKCCFEDANLPGQNFKGANLGSAILSGATLTNANFSGANLGKACLVDANLTGAIINGSTNTGGTIFCRTTMPDGNENNSGCARGTRCCPTCDEDNLCPDGEVCCKGSCRPGECCDADDCDPNEQCCGGECISSTVCCTAGGPACTDGKECLINGSCGAPCDGDTCPPGCGCSLPNAEGDRYCAQFLPECPAQTCSSTTECPAGTMCHNTGTPPCPEGQFLCWPMCAA